MSKITKVEIHSFQFPLKDMSLGDHSATGVGNIIYKKGASCMAERFAVRIICDDGCVGEYLTHWGGTVSTRGQIAMLAPRLIGQDPEQRQLIFDDLKREIRAYDHMGHGPLDIALWDLAGKKYNTSVSKLLGGYRKRLPAYASTYHGQEEKGGLDTPQAFADYAVACKEKGFTGFKIHGWHNGDAKREAETALRVRDAVGHDMKLMNDPACQLRTYMDALYVGRACDEADFFWLEDPFRDNGTSITAQKRLRDQILTPILGSEYIRGLEIKADFLLQGGCDMLHLDPEYDMGITGAMKLAHLSESLGLDVQMHACGPAHRAVISALRNTHFYEMALVGPGMMNTVAPVYTCGYSDQPEDLAPDGTVEVPDGPGLGVVYDWDYIKKNQTGFVEFS